MPVDSGSVDTYDKYLNEMGVNLRRRQEDLAKDDGLIILHAMGFTVPAHGTATDMLQTLVRDFYDGDIEKARQDPVYTYYNVIVIDDVKKHNPINLKKMHVEEAAKHHPTKYVSQYIQQGSALTYTMLRLGVDTYWYESKSNDEFRSNVGKVERRLFDSKQFARLQGIEKAVLDAFRLPVMSIDFLPAGRGKEMIAVDVNTAPMLKFTPLAKADPEEIANSIAKYMKNI